jgi:hypothetical protein
MKTIINLSILAFLLLTPSSHCLAAIGVGDVSPDEARALGVAFRTNTNGEAGIQVWLELKSEGELKKITYVKLQIGEGESRIMSAALPVSYSTPGKGVVTFSAYPAYLPKSTLMIVVYNGPRGDIGYRFKVKDFIELDKLR